LENGFDTDICVLLYEGKISPQVQRDLQMVLGAYTAGVMTGRAVRNRRAVEVLEHIGTKEARALLQTWSRGLKEATLTRYAKAALERMGDR
jgi:hypothetical protein